MHSLILLVIVIFIYELLEVAVETFWTEVMATVPLEIVTVAPFYQSKVLCLPRVNGLSLKAYFQPCPAYFIEHFMVGVQCLAQGHFSGGNFNVPVRGFELATFRYQDRSPNRSATAAHSQIHYCK